MTNCIRFYHNDSVLSYLSPFQFYNIWDHKNVVTAPDTFGTLVPTPLVNSLVISFQDLPNRDVLFLYNALKDGVATTPGLFVLKGDANGIIPIANENDVVSSRELKFSDNDELATLLAVGFGAQLLLIGTSVDGVLDNNGNVIRQIEKFDDKILALATKEKSAAYIFETLS